MGVSSRLRLPEGKRMNKQEFSITWIENRRMYLNCINFEKFRR